MMSIALVSVALAGGFGGSAVWDALPGDNACPDIYDYFPEGGFRIFMCHVKSATTVSALQERAGGRIWVSGPHTGKGLTWSARSDFGHYDPAFVRWVVEWGIPDDPATVARLAPAYDAWVRPLARTVYRTRRALEADPACRERELGRYRQVITAGETDGYIERWYDFLGWEACASSRESMGRAGNGNVVKSAVGFWLRREIDGTADLWDAGLQRLLRTFDGSWLAQSAGSAEAISFATGSHSAVIRGAVPASGAREWSFVARGGQRLAVGVVGSDRVELQVRTSDGRSLFPDPTGSWTGTLPASAGPYTVAVVGSGAFELFVGVW